MLFMLEEISSCGIFSREILRGVKSFSFLIIILSSKFVVRNTLFCGVVCYIHARQMQCSPWSILSSHLEKNKKEARGQKQHLEMAEVVIKKSDNLLWWSCRLICPDGQRWGQTSANSACHSQPKGCAEATDLAEDEGSWSARAVVVLDKLWSPSGGIGEQAEGKEDCCKRLDRPAQGKHGAADTPPTADGHQGEQVGDDHE